MLTYVCRWVLLWRKHSVANTIAIRCSEIARCVFVQAQSEIVFHDQIYIFEHWVFK